MRKGAFNHQPSAQFRARQLRSEMSVSEQTLWAWLRKDQTGFHFRRQVRVDRYYLDFYCAAAKICVEVDGEQHGERVPQDAYRDRVLRSHGIETIRIPSLDLFDNDSPKLERWIKHVIERCQERASPFSPRAQDTHGKGDPDE